MRRFFWGGMALAVVVGCGGSEGGGSSSGRVLRYGSVASPVMDSMARSLGSGSFSPGQTVRKGDVVALDGDAMSPAQLTADREIDRILAAGASVLVVDAKEAHKEAMLTATRAGASAGDDSHAILYAPFGYAGGRRGVYMLDLAGGDRTVTTKSVMQRTSGTVQGTVAKKTAPRKLSPVTLDRFATRVKALGEGTWTDPLASTVPPLVSWMSAPYELIEQADDADLNGQSITEDVTFIFRGFYSPPAQGGVFSNAILVEHDGTISTGAKTVDSVTPGDNGVWTGVFGWFQTGTLVSVTPDRSNPSGTLVAPGVTNMNVSGDTYQGDLTAFIAYYDASGNFQSWEPNWSIPATPLTVPGWTLAAQDSDPVFNYYQQSPFDASLASPDYIDAIDPNNIGSFQALPDASNNSLSISGTSSFATSARIDGPVRFNLRVGRTYTRLVTEFVLSPALTLGGGGTTFEEDGNRPFVINLAQCQPASGTP